MIFGVLVLRKSLYENLFVDFKGEMDETLLMGNNKRAVGGVGDRRANY